MENLILIGMPGAGKSTAGVVLAKRLGYRFLDSDLVIQEKTGKLLYQLIDEQGEAGFLMMENDINAAIDVEQTVIATGGSAVYGQGAMEHFHTIGTIVYLQLPFESVRKRLGDLHKRGVIQRNGSTLEELYAERIPLYERYADITIACEGKELRQIIEEIAEKVK